MANRREHWVPKNNFQRYENTNIWTPKDDLWLAITLVTEHKFSRWRVGREDNRHAILNATARMNGWLSDQNYTFDQVVARIASLKARHDCWHMMINTTRCVWDRDFTTICAYAEAWEFWLDVMIRQTRIGTLTSPCGTD
ncbi:hypothetical protein ACS0TY_012081 [Phlomoides rotata]